MLIIMNEKTVVLKKGSIEDIEEIPDSSREVIFYKTTPPDVISRLGEIKPNIITAYLRYRVPNDLLNALPATIRVIRIDEYTAIENIRALPSNITLVFLGKGVTPEQITALPDNTTMSVGINEHTPEDAISALSTKPRIETVFLGSGLSPRCIRKIPDSVVGVGIDGNTPLDAISALRDRPRIDTVLLGSSISRKHINALPENSIKIAEVYKNTPQKAIRQLATKENITVVYLINANDSHINALPNSIKIVRTDRKTIINTSHISWNHLKNKESEVTLYFNPDVNTQQKKKALGTSQLPKRIKVSTITEVKENKLPPKDNLTFFRPISPANKNRRYYNRNENQGSYKSQKPNTGLRC